MTFLRTPNKGVTTKHNHKSIHPSKQHAKRKEHWQKREAGYTVDHSDGNVYYFSLRGKQEYRDEIAYSFLHQAVLDATETIDIYSPVMRHNILYKVVPDSMYTASELVGKLCILSIQGFRDGRKIAVARLAPINQTTTK